MSKIVFHSISKSRNLPEERAKFFSDLDYSPDLRLSVDKYNPADIKERILKAEKYESVYLNLILHSVQRDVEGFRKLNEDVYGKPDKELFNSLIGYLHSLSVARSKSKEYDQLLKLLIGVTPTKYYSPSKLTFDKYSKFLQTIYDQEVKDLNKIQIGQSFTGLLNTYLTDWGLAKAGWTSAEAKKGGGLFVIAKKKKVYAPINRVVASKLRAKQMLAHELLVHVRRRVNGVAYSASEEGIAVLVEQLIAKKFSYKRSIRYFAICYAHGISGAPKDFRQTYEAVLLVVGIFSLHSAEKAKETAFNETARAFRGGHADIAGFVFLKDMVYFSSNIKLWKKIESENPDLDEFKKIITGDCNE